ncbi:DegQ family serine endoprotease [Salinarimonas ramus]|uniref:Serine protease n=1 Tax=Salinarimonas ramus TaxID=690164 RepID=A0A917Q4M7_9HYPH|nr:DegQ family serine endoprotease [Salinarimonas ramus]GGK23116.1 serine protease [Salinarimonas ramus]
MARIMSRATLLAGFAALAAAAAALAWSGPGSQAQDRPAQDRPEAVRAVPESAAHIQLTFAPLVRDAAPAVVNVYGESRQRAQSDPREDFFRRFFGDDAFGGMPRERVQRSLGSGVIVDASGLVVTNNHVVEGMDEVRVALVDRRELDAEIVLRDPRTDLAVLRIDADETFPAVPLGDDATLEVGDLVLAIGNPFGVGQTVTQGIVSALARTQVGISDYQFFIQTDAAINPGNSGGALLDMAGRLVGINTAIFSRSGGSHGIGFAIPATMVRAVVASAEAGSERVQRPWLGASLQALTPDLAEGVGLLRPVGALVTDVDPRGPAAEAGLARGDVILAVDGQEISDTEAFGYRFALAGVSGESVLRVLGRGGERELRVRLVPPPEDPPREAVRVDARSPLDGAVVVNVSPAVADEMRILQIVGAVVVQEVPPRSLAARYGFRPGDALLEINRMRIEATSDVERALSRGRGVWELTIHRDGRTITTVLRG